MEVSVAEAKACDEEEHGGDGEAATLGDGFRVVDDSSLFGSGLCWLIRGISRGPSSASSPSAIENRLSRTAAAFPSPAWLPLPLRERRIDAAISPPTG